MKKPVVCIIIVLLWGLLNASFADMPHIGKIKGTKGIASVNRNGRMIPALPQMKVYLNDILITGSDGVIGVLLEDNTLLSMGRMSRLTLDKFDFSPADNKYALQLRMQQGTFVYLSGLLGKLAPHAVQIETPSGNISMLKESNFMVRFPGDE